MGPITAIKAILGLISLFGCKRWAHGDWACKRNGGKAICPCIVHLSLYGHGRMLK